MKMTSAIIGLCVASTAIVIAAALTTSVDSLSVERDPCTTCFALALCVALHGGIALIVRGVRPRGQRAGPKRWRGLVTTVSG